MSDLYLSEEEVKHITKKTQSKAQRLELERMGYRVEPRSDGSFWVPRPQFLDRTSARKDHKLNLGALNDGAAA